MRQFQYTNPSVSGDLIPQINTFIKLNEYSTQDDLIQYGQNTFEGKFFDYSYSDNNLLPYDNTTVFVWSFYLNGYQMIHSR